MFKRFFAGSVFVLFSFCVFAQNFILSGTISDDASSETLIGATVTVGEKGTITDFDGHYEIELPIGRHVVLFSYVGFDPVEKTIDLSSNQTLDITLGSIVLSEIIVTADIAIERKTPVAFSNIPTLKIQEELSGQDLPLILNSTPGAYATQSGGGDGDARITIRGFNQRNIAVMLDGVPVNDMENGWVYWSNWFGLDLVTQTVQIQRGLGASKLSLPSVGGTLNIITKGIDAKRSLKLKQEIGNNGFSRSTFGLTTGRLKSGWGVSLAGSYKQGDGWVDGTFTKGYFYYARVNKQWGKHSLSLQAFGAPQEHGQRPFTAEIGQIDSNFAKDLGVSQEVLDKHVFTDKGRRFNEHWGYRDGKVFTSRKNYYHKPQISLRHSSQLNDRTYVSNIAYLSIGNGGGTAPDGQSIPRDSTGLMNFEEAIANNGPTIFNPDSVANHFLRTGINNHFWYGLLSTVQHNLNQNWTLSGGFDARYYKGEHYREVYDLLGAGSATVDSFTNLQVGDKFEYNYTGFVRWLGAFTLLEYSKDKISTFLNLSAASSGYRVEDYFKDQALDWINLHSLTAKTGLAFNINESQNVFFNTGYLSKAQRFSNVINTNRFGQDLLVFNDYENENILAFEGGYSFKSKWFSAKLNAYFTNWQNKPLDSPPTVAIPDEDGNIDEDSERIPVNISGIDAIHQGIELDFSIEPFKQLAFEGLLSLGDWTWNSGAEAIIQLPNDFEHSFEFDATGVHVGDAAQTQIGGLVRYEPIKGLYFKLKGTYFGRHWAEFQPESLNSASGTARMDSWQLPNYTLMDFHSGYRFKLKKYKVSVRFNILNLLDTTYISDARNNDRFNSPSYNDFDAKSASVHFGQGRRWTTSIQLEF